MPTPTASAVDMESADLADAAAKIGVPFLVVRIVIDGCDEDVPASAAAGVDRGGNPTPFTLLRALVARPADIRGIVRLARRLDAANRSLHRALAEIVGADPNRL